MQNWKPIIGYEGIYEINEVGTVRRIKTSPGARRGHIMQWSFTGKYYQVNLSKDGVNHHCLVHRLVALNFIPNFDPARTCINHKDSNPANNHIDNLEWVTHGENSRHAARNGRMARGERHGMSKLTEKAVREIRIRHSFRKVTQKMLAEEYNVSLGTIESIIGGHTWKHVLPQETVKSSKNTSFVAEFATSVLSDCNSTTT